jgi:hypothetical protein
LIFFGLRHIPKMSRKSLPFSITGFISGGPSQDNQSSAKRRSEKLPTDALKPEAKPTSERRVSSFADARKLFADRLNSIGAAANENKGKGLTAGELMDLFLDWIKKNRSKRTYVTRKTNRDRFG